MAPVEPGIPDSVASSANPAAVSSATTSSQLESGTDRHHGVVTLVGDVHPWNGDPHHRHVDPAVGDHQVGAAAEHQSAAGRVESTQRLDDLGGAGGGDQIRRRSTQPQRGELGEQDGGGHVGKGRE